MHDYSIDKKYLRNISYSSMGVQNKYFKDNYWYKENVSGYENEAEYLATLIMQCSNIDNYVKYEKCKINEKNGCRSKNFLSEGENFVTIQRLYDYAFGGKLIDKIYMYADVKDRIEYVIDFIHQRTNLDYKEYIQKMLTLDMLILNPDRHFHNFGVISCKDGGYREAPIFDNGAALFSNYSLFPPYLNYEECREKISGAPFSGSLEQQAIVAGIGLKLDYDKLNVLLDLHNDATRGSYILRCQLDLYKSVIPDLS